tara:strand:- start:63 stop:683 length:621 start_codon:yes stop_codon:yes gene_type:complete
MAYLLGRDVKVALTTEVDGHGISFTSTAAQLEDDGSVTAGDGLVAARDVGDPFGGVLTAGSMTPFTDVTGVDVSIGAVDEDVAYLGQRTTLKAEIKKETTITITRKKSNNHLELLFQGARYGLKNDTNNTLQTHTALVQPNSTTFGYRVHLAFDDGVDVMSIPHCQISSYSATMSADGVQEETIELVSHVTPIVGINENKSDASGF